MKMNIIKVTTRAQLDELYKDWSLTIEGLAPDEANLKEFLEWVRELTPLKHGLTGTNAYPGTGCTIVCIKRADMERPNAVTTPRFQIQGRWFYDVVDNNVRREEEKRGACEC